MERSILAYLYATLYLGYWRTSKWDRTLTPQPNCGNILVLFQSLANTGMPLPILLVSRWCRVFIPSVQKILLQTIDVRNISLRQPEWSSLVFITFIGTGGTANCGHSFPLKNNSPLLLPYSTDSRKECGLSLAAQGKHKQSQILENPFCYFKKLMMMRKKSNTTG